MSTAMARPSPRSAWSLVRAAWERTSVYLPIILMGLIALGTYWLARNTPSFGVAEPQRPARHEPDSFMRGFSVKTYDAAGRLKSEVHGAQARHYPDTDTLEVDQPRLRSYDQRGELTVASARRALSNADGSEIELFGDAIVTRQPGPTSPQDRPTLQFRGDFLHAYLDPERVVSNKPVELLRGADRITGDSMDYDNVSRVLVMTGHVRGVLAARERRSP